jgi:hypothetical protein
MKKLIENLYLTFGALLVLIIPTAIAGWISNVYQLTQMESILDNAIGIVKLVGCFIFPIGSILGVVGWF